MTNIDLQQLTSLALSHKWVAFAALVIGLIVRVLKSDVPLTPTVPPRWRPWLAFGLGLAAGVLNKAMSGASWADAIVSGAIAGLVPVLGHELLIESLAGGRELPVPSVGRPPSPPAPPVVALLALAASLSSIGCGAFLTRWSVRADDVLCIAVVDRDSGAPQADLCVEIQRPDGGRVTMARAVDAGGAR